MLHKTDQKGKKLWNPAMIAWMAVLLSFFPAGILYGLNFLRVGQQERARKTFIMILLGFATGAMTLFKFYYLDSVVKLLICLNVGTALFYYLSQHGIYKSFIKAEGKRASMFLPGVLALFGMLILACGFYMYYDLEGKRDLREMDRAIQLMEVGELEEAELIWRDYIAKYPGEPNLYWNLAVVYLKTEEYPKAMYCFTKVADLDPSYPQLSEFMGYVQELLIESGSK